MRSHPRGTGLGLALLVAATAAAPAAARPIETAMPTVATESQSAASTPREARTVRVTVDQGFDWGDAGIGAGSALALTMIALGAASTVSHRRAPHTRAPAAS